MSTTIDGTNPKSETGRSFAPSIRHMNPLAKFLDDIEDERQNHQNAAAIYQDYNLWYCNQGAPLDENGCLQLAALVRQALNNGQAARWAEENGHASHLTSSGNVVYHIGGPCSLFSEQWLAHLAKFLETCGGFTVT